MDSGSHAANCRALCEGARVAALGTIAREHPGHPFVTLASVAFDARGRALLLLSRLAEHTGNLEASGHASLLVSEARPGEPDPLALGRVTIVGTCRKVPDGEVEACRATFLDAHPEAQGYVGFADFGFFRLEPEAVRYVGGFGRMSWVDAKAYADAWA